MINEERARSEADLESVSAPIERRKTFWTEKRYNMFNYIGLVIQLTPTIIYGWMRADAQY